MKKILSEIQSGEFAKTWLKENRDGRKNFLAMREAARIKPIEKVGAELRAMMPFLKKRKEAGVPEEAVVGSLTLRGAGLSACGPLSQWSQPLQRSPRRAFPERFNESAPARVPRGLRPIRA